MKFTINHNLSQQQEEEGYVMQEDTSRFNPNHSEFLVPLVGRKKVKILTFSGRVPSMPEGGATHPTTVY